MRLPVSVPRLMTLYAIGCALVLAQVVYWQQVRGDELSSHPRNRRYWSAVQRAKRGRITARGGEELAVSVEQDAESRGPASRIRLRRVYPRGAAFGHITGYSSLRYGESGVEAALNRYLLGLDAPPRTPHDLTDLLLTLATPPTTVGYDVNLTIDAGLQRAACRALGQRRGAIVAIDVRTGAILAMADWPRFDPGDVEKDWKSLGDDPGRPLLARAYQGLYPPGSVFKVVTAAAAVEAGIPPDREFVCEGVKSYRHSTVKCHRSAGHGRLTLAEGVAKSCNIVLAETALAIGPTRFEAVLAATGLGHRPRIFRPGNDASGSVAAGSFPRGDELTPQELAACGYGQGALLVTPLYIASAGQMLGNDGVLLEPYLVSRAVGPDGAVVYRHPEEGGRPVVSAAAAREVLEMMRLVMQPGGTASHLGLPGVAIAGKTGSAQNPHGRAHSWFLASAPATAPRLAVAAVVENAGAGGRAAGPAVMKVLEAGL